MNNTLNYYSNWIVLVLFASLFFSSFVVFVTVVCCRRTKNRTVVYLLTSIFITGCLIFPYSIIVIQRQDNFIEYGTWAHTLGSAGLFFSGISYWIFASAYLKTSIILKKLLKKMKLQIFTD